MPCRIFTVYCNLRQNISSGGPDLTNKLIFAYHCCTGTECFDGVPPFSTSELEHPIERHISCLFFWTELKTIRVNALCHAIVS